MRRTLECTLVVALIALSPIGCGSPTVLDDASADAGQDGGQARVCTRQSECPGTFCSPMRCAPGEPGAGADGCLAEVQPCDEGETCDEAGERCLADDCASGADADGDGDPRPDCGGHDCDDGDDRVRSTAIEVCDAEGLDEDCNPETIHGPDDGDADRDSLISYECFNRDDEDAENRGTDCDDTAPGDGLGTVDDCSACRDRCAMACTSERACEDYREIVAGSRFTCGLTSEGRVFCWGTSSRGQLGNGTTLDSSSPVEVSGIGDAIEIAAGSSHVCVIIASGEVRCWGDNSAGQLGNRTRGGFSAVPVATYRPFGERLGQFVPVSGLDASGSLTCAIAGTGTATSVQCWGDNTFGQLGRFDAAGPTTEPSDVAGSVHQLVNPVRVAVGATHGCALLADGSVRCWGMGDLVGDGVADHGATCGGRDCTLAVAVAGLTNPTHMAAGPGITCAHDADGTARCWGSLETPTARAELMGFRDLELNGTSCGIDPASSPSCWGGTNVWGTLGDGTRMERAEPGPVSGLEAVTDVAVGGDHACAVDASGSAWCWGSNRSGELGDGVIDHMMGGCSYMTTGPRDDCSLVPVEVSLRP